MCCQFCLRCVLVHAVPLTLPCGTETNRRWPSCSQYLLLESNEAALKPRSGTIPIKMFRLPFYFWHVITLKHSWCWCQTRCPFGQHLTLYSVFYKTHGWASLLTTQICQLWPIAELPPYALLHSQPLNYALTGPDRWISAGESSAFHELSSQNKNTKTLQAVSFIIQS